MLRLSIFISAVKAEHICIFEPIQVASISSILTTTSDTSPRPFDFGLLADRENCFSPTRSKALL
jgi:hypothetical protein